MTLKLQETVSWRKNDLIHQETPPFPKLLLKKRKPRGQRAEQKNLSRMWELLTSAFFLMLCTLLNCSKKNGRLCIMLVFRDTAVGIHDGTSVTLWGTPSRDESCKDPRGPLGSGCYRSSVSRARKDHPRLQRLPGLRWRNGKGFAAHDPPLDEEGHIRHGWLKGVGSWPSLEQFSHIL